MSSQQPNLPALAKQGDATAIAALMNRSLQPKGIVARAAYKEGHLRVLLEGQTIPDQTLLAPYIRKGILALQIPGLHTLSVVGRLRGANAAAWSETFTLTATKTRGLTPPQPQSDSTPQTLKATVGDSASAVGNHSTVSQENHSSIEPNASSVTDPAAIATQLNQAMGTEALMFEATVSDRILKLIAKTDQILEGDTFAKTAQTLLLPLNLSDIDFVQLYKQKTKSNNPYKIKEFTLQKEPAPTETTANDATEPPATASAALYQSPRSQPAPAQAIKSTTQAPSQPNNKSKFVMLGLAALLVVVLIGAIKFLAKPPSTTEVCADAAGAPGYCQLAVQMVGEQTLHNLKESAIPFTPEMEERGLEICVNAAGAKVPRTLSRQRERYDSSIRKEPISPGVMMEAQLKTVPQRSIPQRNGTTPQASPIAEETVFRSACLFTNQNDRVQLVKHVVLPNNWPEEPYQGKQEWEPMQRSLKVYQILIMLGGGTLFTAIGLFAASMFNLGFQIYSIRGLFQTASILGTLDTLLIVLSGAHLHLFGGVPLTCLALGLTQVWVKDLRVDWASGYQPVALGVFLMMVIRFVLNWLLIGFIFSVL